MWPCIVSRTSSSLMDTSCPSMPTPPPPLSQPQPQQPHPTKHTPPLYHLTTNTMKSWRTGPAPGHWMAMSGHLGFPVRTAVQIHRPKCTPLATTTMNPGTGASPDERAKAGAKLTPTLWESHSPQTVGMYSAMYLETSDLRLSDWPFCILNVLSVVGCRIKTQSPWSIKEQENKNEKKQLVKFCICVLPLISPSFVFFCSSC